MRRFFVEASVAPGGIIEVHGDEFRHMRDVLRLVVGEEVILFCGDGMDMCGEILSFGKDNAQIKITSVKKNEAELNRYIAVFAGCPKGEKADFIVQKSVELGAKEIVFFDSRYTVAKQKDNKNERFCRIALEAVKQCGGAVLPHIEAGVSFDKMCKNLSSFDLVILANECENTLTLTSLLASQEGKAGRIALISGSEGGFAPEEVQKIIKCGAVSVSLGKRILRAETAVLAQLAIVANWVST